MKIKPFTKFSRSQAYYLWRKLRDGNISRSLLSKLCTFEGEVDLWSWLPGFSFGSIFAAIVGVILIWFILHLFM